MTTTHKPRTVWADHVNENPHAPRYNATAVDTAIAAGNRAGRRIGKRETQLIHGLLKGWRG